MAISKPQSLRGISTFEDLLSPVDPAVFLRDIFGQQPLYISGTPDRFSSVLTWSDLNTIVSRQPFDSLNVRVVKNGQAIPPEEYTRAVNIALLGKQRQLDAIKLTKILRDGATFTLDLYRDIHEPIQSIANVLQRVLFSCVHAVIIAGWHNIQCFDTHWDPTDIFVLQISGRKHWRVLEPVRRHPLFEDKQAKIEPPKEPYWEGDLNPGDLLHIPRGWWHDARPYSSPSLHITFVVLPATGLDIAMSLLNRLKEFEIMRANVPRHASEAEKVTYLEEFQSTIRTAVSEISLERFFSTFDSALPLRARISLPWSAAPASEAIPDSARLEWLPIHSTIVSRPDGDLELETFGSSFILPKHLYPILVDLIGQRVITLSDLSARHPKLNAADAVLELLSLSLLRIDPSEP